MPVDARKQETRRPSRAKAAGRLFALLGLPLILIFGVFAGGVLFGAKRSYRVQTFEAKYLGLEAPAGFGEETPATPSEPAPAVEPQPAEPTQPAEPKPAVEQPKPTQPVIEPTQPVVEPTQPVVEPTQPTQPVVEPKPVGALAIASADPIGAELRKLFDAPQVVRVKVLVDPALVVAREDWLGYVADLITATNASFQVMFGVQVQLQGVVIWERQGDTDAKAMLADLAAREREGADVVLGLVASTAPANFQAPLWPELHGDHALVFADLRTRDRYYRNLLRSLAQLLGAAPTNDPAARQLGSFMSDAEPLEGAAPSIDPENRGRVIIAKQRGFADSRTKAQPGEGEEI